MIPVSVVIVTKDEEENIKDAIESVRDCSEIIVIDSFSTDRTVEICRNYTEKVFQEPWQGYARQKQAGIDKASFPWVLVLDADERIPPELKSEISQAISDSQSDGFYIPRKNFFLGRWIRHSGWWPDYTLRLFRKEKGYMEDREVHEKIVVNGTTEHLKHPMEHYTYRSLSDFLKKMEEYTILSSRELAKKDHRPGLFSLALRPLFTFAKMFFIKKGFLDGSHGLILAILYSCYTFLKYAKVWEKLKK